MTSVTVQRDDKGVCGLRVSGHAGYDRAGSDIVCAAASVLITTCANALESVAGVQANVVCREHPALIEIALPDGLCPQAEHDARIILQTTLCGFEDVAAQYPRYLRIL